MDESPELKIFREAKAAPVFADEANPDLWGPFVEGPFLKHGTGAIDCTLIHPVHGRIPFTASPEDPEPHGRAIHAYCSRQMEAE